MGDYNIRFTYDNPIIDLISNYGFNSDSSISYSITLMQHKNLLLENIRILDALLENSESIRGIMPNGDESQLQISIQDVDVANRLLESRTILPIYNDDQEIPFSDESDSETNYDRYKRVKNLSAVDDKSRFYSDTDSSSEELSNESFISIEDKQLDVIIKKYQRLMDDDE